jgi:hypothetical protein
VSRRFAVFSALVFVAAFHLTGCSRAVEPPSAFTIEHKISPDPARVGPATVSFKLTDAAGKPLARAHITVEADMTHAGMSPSFAETKETDAGHYRAHLEFQMPGDWVLLLHITLSGGKKLERQIEVKGVRAN